MTSNRALWRVIVALAVFGVIAAACEYDPGNASTPGTATCGGVQGTHGFGYALGFDPVGGSTYEGTEGDDVIVIVNGPVTVNALGGDDLICVNSVFGTAAGERIVINGGDGNDTIVGSPTSIEVCAAEVTSDCDIPASTTTTTTTTTTVPSDETEYFVVGDSLCGLALSNIEAAAALAGIQDDLTIDCLGGRSPHDGRSVLEMLTTHPDVLVVELGTNPGDLNLSMAMMDDTVAEFSDSVIYFVTSHREDPAFQVFLDQLNEHSSGLASVFSQVNSCDWASIIADNQEWYSDGIHYNATGQEVFGAYIVSCMLGLESS